MKQETGAMGVRWVSKWQNDYMNVRGWHLSFAGNEPNKRFGLAVYQLLPGRRWHWFIGWFSV